MGIGVVILVARDGEWERLCVCVCGGVKGKALIESMWRHRTV